MNQSFYLHIFFYSELIIISYQYQKLYLLTLIFIIIIHFIICTKFTDLRCKFIAFCVLTLIIDYTYNLFF